MRRFPEGRVIVVSSSSPKAWVWGVFVERQWESFWSDSLGRPWFEAENNKYHCRGCVMVRGNDAWLLYYGYRREMPAKPDEVLLAARSLETIVPSDLHAKRGDESSRRIAANDSTR